MQAKYLFKRNKLIHIINNLYLLIWNDTMHKHMPSYSLQHSTKTHA